ncbi:hypothetical protein Val02_62480 [Virgisporangium aliadipatigenens]|uniref:ATP/GTP-binding protein n=2 Tax=Virgisporangium aliadipatigenens TaxID=741659 RepID=A0A8J4DUP2_9ACTN|nr:hypothetical protein Val02_62480 [Virgisporangium aliadipatigenens]
MGEGSTVTCAGPGTVFTFGVHDPNAGSPTCGFTYRRSSQGRQFTVSATVTYRVTWAGGGQSGTVGDLTATWSTLQQVDEAQSVVTG